MLCGIRSADPGHCMPDDLSVSEPMKPYLIVAVRRKVTNRYEIEEYLPSFGGWYGPITLLTEVAIEKGTFVPTTARGEPEDKAITGWRKNPKAPNDGWEYAAVALYDSDDERRDDDDDES